MCESAARVPATAVTRRVVACPDDPPTNVQGTPSTCTTTSHVHCSSKSRGAQKGSERAGYRPARETYDHREGGGLLISFTTNLLGRRILFLLSHLFLFLCFFLFISLLSVSVCFLFSDLSDLSLCFSLSLFPSHLSSLTVILSRLCLYLALVSLSL